MCIEANELQSGQASLEVLGDATVVIYKWVLFLRGYNGGTNIIKVIKEPR